MMASRGKELRVGLKLPKIDKQGYLYQNYSFMILRVEVLP
jgi:hypothetical protein